MNWHLYVIELTSSINYNRFVYAINVETNRHIKLMFKQNRNAHDLHCCKNCMHAYLSFKPFVYCESNNEETKEKIIDTNST